MVMHSNQNKAKILMLSVCVPTYQHANYIEKCLEGILMQQTNFDFEIILGEDNSQDGTREICKEYAEKYPGKIRLFLRKREDVIYINNNPTGRFNFTECLKEAKGKYIALCEGDDYWTDPLKLQKQVDFLETNENYSGCFHYTQQLLENNKNGKVYGRHEDKKDFSTIDTFSTTALFHTSSFVFRKTLLQLPSWYYKVVSADMALFSIISKCGKIYCMPEVMSIYRSHPGGITKTAGLIKNYHKNRIELMNHLNEFHDYKFNEAAQNVIKYHQKALESVNYNEKSKLTFRDRLKKILKITR